MSLVVEEIKPLRMDVRQGLLSSFQSRFTV